MLEVSSLVVRKAAFTRADCALKGFLIDDAFVCKGVEDGFMFLAVASLGRRFGCIGKRILTERISRRLRVPG